MRGSDFVFDLIDRLYHGCNEISLDRGRSYIDSSKCLESKKAAINLKKRR